MNNHFIQCHTFKRKFFFSVSSSFDFRVAFCYAEFLGVRKQAIYLRVWLPLFGRFSFAFNLLGGRSQLWYIMIFVSVYLSIRMIFYGSSTHILVRWIILASFESRMAHLAHRPERSGYWDSNRFWKTCANHAPTSFHICTFWLLQN